MKIKFYLSTILFYICIALQGKGQCIFDFPDVVVLPSNIPQSEVNISINPINSSNLILSFNIFSNSTYDLQGYAYSNDGGNTWVGNNNLQGNINTIGDPSTSFDANGNAYISGIPYNFNLNNPGPTGVFTQISYNNGITWNNFYNPSNIIGGEDKDMLNIDTYPSSPYKDNIYCGWAQNSHPTINYFVPGGNSFTTPFSFSKNFGNGVNIQTGSNGHIYMCWADYGNSIYPPATGMGFALSTDGGATFPTNGIVFNYSGIAIHGAGKDPNFNNIRVNDFPSMAVDKSNGINKGRIYIVYPEEVNNKAVIQFRYSDQEGSISSWSSAQTISPNNFQQSFFPWISVDNTNGDIYIIYYAFDQSSGFSTNTYVAYSNNGGTSFQNLKVSDVAHITQPINSNSPYAGDYIGIVAYGNKAWGAWMDNRNGTWQIYVSQVAKHSTAPILQIDPNYNNWYCSYMTGDYYVNSIPNAITYTWTTTNGLKIDGSSSPYTSSSTSVTISNQSDNNLSGQVSVLANYSCGTSYPDSLPFNGTPDFTPTYKVFCPSNPYNADSTTAPYIAAGPLTVYFYSAPSNLRISAYRWYIDYSTSYIQTSTNNLPYPTTGTHAVSVSIDTQCGWSLQTLWQQVTLCGSSPTMATYTGTKASLKSKGILSKNEGYLIYPNPVNSSLQVEDKKGDPLGLIKLYDSQGRLIKQMQTGSSYISMPLYNLADGLYILKIVNKNLIPFTKKIMINK